MWKYSLLNYNDTKVSFIKIMYVVVDKEVLVVVAQPDRPSFGSIVVPGLLVEFVVYRFVVVVVAWPIAAVGNSAGEQNMV